MDRPGLSRSEPLSSVRAPVPALLMPAPAKKRTRSLPLRVERVPVQPLVYSVKEAMVALGIGKPATLYGLLMGPNPPLRSFKLGQRRLIPVVALEEYVRHEAGLTS